MPLQIFVANADGSGTPTQLTGGPGQGQQFLPEWSPDGSEVVFVSNRATGAEIWAVNVVSRAQRRIIACCEGATFPTWSPDSQTIAFSSGVGGTRDIWFVDRDGSNRRRITNDVETETVMRFSPDGSKLVMQRQGGRLWTMNVDGTGLTQIPPPPHGEHRTPDWQPVFAAEEDTAPPFVTGPDDLTAEATGPDGTMVTFEVSAEDDVDGELTVTCDWESGATFPLGTTAVTCAATDRSGNTGVASFTVSVQDTTAPVISGTPADQTVEATGPAGAIAAFVVPTANDLVDGARVVECSPVSGSTFPIGATSVTCTASDSRENSASTTFSVVVVDTTPPTISGTPGDLTVEATGPTGAALSYTPPTASDLVDGSRLVSCSPAQGNIIGLGTTTVTCSARDTQGNSASASFIVTVQDTTAPEISVPAAITVDATGPSGASVTFSVSATDLVDSNQPVSCEPASGSTFPIGTTTVSCFASDSRGNAARHSFTVTVKDAATQVADQKLLIQGMEGISAGTKASLMDKLTNIQTSLDVGQVHVACHQFNGYVNQIEALLGKIQLPQVQAEFLSANALRIMAVLGCG